MPCVSPLGYPAKKMSLRETLMRKGVRADSRIGFRELFFDGSFDKPLKEEQAGELLEVLEAVRLAPSAVNKQPWRVVLLDDTDRYAIRGLRIHLTDYLVRPLEEQQFRSAMERIFM